MQDMGAAGITCSTSEMSAGGGVGMDIYLDKVPTRQAGMQPFEILLSESQERMLIVVRKGQEEVVNRIFEKWDLHAVHIGDVTEGNTLRYFMNGELVSEIPAKSLVLGGGAPVYEREYTEPAYYAEAKKFSIDSIAEPKDLVVVARQLMANHNIASKKWIYEQYDSMVGTANMSTNKPSDAAIVNIKNTNKALVLSVDCNGRYVQADPEIGTMIAVCEAARNIVCSGGEPSAITNCLNFGNPYNPEVYWQFVGAIKGMSAACKKFETPVTGGNVSFYNQTVNADGSAAPVFPTPTIGMLGVMKDKSLQTTLDFKYKGDLIYLLGVPRGDINSSEYLYSFHGVKNSPAPFFDLEEEFNLQQCLKALIRNNYISSAHDVSDGGLFVTLCEMALPNSLGFDIVTDSEIRRDAFLFGESQSRIAVTVVEDYEDEFLDFVGESGIQVMLLGHVTKGRVTIDEENFGFIEDYRTLYEKSIAEAMAN
jgi:phosphoribosylformylglycinamidine synthase II